jgi:hypothetical protein
MCDLSRDRCLYSRTPLVYKSIQRSIFNYVVGALIDKGFNFMHDKEKSTNFF